MSKQREWLICPSVWKPGCFALKRLRGQTVRNYRLIDWFETIAAAMDHIARVERLGGLH